MKSIIAFYLFIFYVLAVSKPVLPIVFDAAAHFFWKAHHISTVHHHQGDNHAEKGVTATHDGENHTNSSPSKISEPVSIHIIADSQHAISQSAIKTLTYGHQVYKEVVPFLEKSYPPPRWC